MATLARKTNFQISPLILLGWVILNLIGFGLAGVFFHNFPLAYFQFKILRLGSFNLFPAIVGFFFGAIPALLIGVFQQLLLRRHLPVSRWWIVSVSAGMGVMHFLSDGFENALDLSIAVLLGGLVVGLVQWRLLRPHLPWASWWIVASVVSWYLGWLMGYSILRAGVTLYLLWLPWESYVKQHGILGGMVGITYGVSTILLLMGLLKKRNE